MDPRHGNREGLHPTRTPGPPGSIKRHLQNSQARFGITFEEAKARLDASRRRAGLKRGAQWTAEAGARRRKARFNLEAAADLRRSRGPAA